MSVFDGLPDSIKRRYLRTYQVVASTGNMYWGDSDGDFRQPIRHSYTKEDVITPKPTPPDFVWCDWCGRKNHYTDLKCSSCGGTL